MTGLSPRSATGRALVGRVGASGFRRRRYRSGERRRARARRRARPAVSFRAWRASPPGAVAESRCLRRINDRGREGAQARPSIRLSAEDRAGSPEGWAARAGRLQVAVFDAVLHSPRCMAVERSYELPARPSRLLTTCWVGALCVLPCDRGCCEHPAALRPRRRRRSASANSRCWCRPRQAPAAVPSRRARSSSRAFCQADDVTDLRRVAPGQHRRRPEAGESAAQDDGTWGASLPQGGDQQRRIAQACLAPSMWTKRRRCSPAA